ncbi:unnamed protein product [Aphanomyces euteiches]|uniref:Uncharacterized protein n=1 Tax=Aphanomyces euteiches TaxID=100861 RepID=A0A6G0XEF6_9STRA|nr:hypothetical protein Ae201684_005659 [Aphanomyces euteiches]KAH9078594.1 hypothetical protein Ae201684P_019674 [Aphanomyces euteiches]KAH9142395.1 hypothetical protein AeRB84_013529 [Aphanomyces euteiches]
MVRIVPSIVALLAATVTAVPHVNPLVLLANVIKAESPQIEQVSTTELFFDKQLLDHNVQACGGEPKYWSHRYYVNDAYYKGPGSPVFLYVEGESPADPFWIINENVHIVILAKKLGALLVSIEHRFYGKSQPLPDWSVESFKYLTMRQAVDDIAHFQDYFSQSRNLTKDTKWVTFGGSYPGQITAYTKLFHPERFAGAVASSATINLITDYPGYAETVADDMKKKGGQQCLDTLRAGLKAVHQLVASNKTEDKATLKKLFNPCDEIVTELDKATFESFLFYPYQGFAQSNDVAAYNVTSVCLDLNAQNGLSPLEKVAKINLRTLSKFTNCTNANYEANMVAGYLDTTSNEDFANRQYQWTMCLEGGGAQTTAGSDSPFSELKYITLDHVWYPICKDAYGLSRESVDASMDRAQKYYQGLHPDVENVVFPGGSFDPWRGLCLDNSSVLLHNSSKVVYIDGVSHCGDMVVRKLYNDTAPLVWARQAIEAKIREFIGGP